MDEAIKERARIACKFKGLGSSPQSYLKYQSFVDGAISQRRIDYDTRHIQAVLYLANKFGVCSDFGVDTATFIKNNLPAILNRLENGKKK